MGHIIKPIFLNFNIMNLPIVVYSHSDYSDLWIPFFEGVKRYYHGCKIYFLIDKPNETFKEKYNLIEVIYDDSEKYSNRLISCLENIEDDFFIYLHEDMLIYDHVDVPQLNKIFNFIKTNNNYKFVRLLKSGVNSNLPVSDNLYRLGEMDFLFSITPTIWDKEYLEGVLNDHKDLSIWDLEIYADRTLREKQEHGLYWYNNEDSRGGHFDSSIFPHMATAIFKGKWNMEYRSELSRIFDEFSIDKNIRGTIF